MTDRLRWGVLATGTIAEDVVPGLKNSELNELVAVGSRSAERAEAFARRHGDLRAYGTYEALLADPDIDCVYVCLPNSMHGLWVTAALAAGKHVLCEKPLTPTVEEAAKLYMIARGFGLVLGEAFMYRYHPKTLGLLELVRGGTLGRVHTIRSSFCYWAEDPESDVRYRPDLAGGSLMDVGSYCVSASNAIADSEPEHVQGWQVASASGVDDRFYGLMSYANGAIASFDCSMRSPLSMGLEVLGTEGTAVVPMPWYAHKAPHTVDVSLRNGESWVIVATDESAYRCETEAFAAVVCGAAALEVSPEETIRNLRTIERLRVAAANSGN